MDPQVRLPSTGRRTQFAVIERLISRVDLPVRLQGVTLREPRPTDLTLVRLLPGVDPQMALQFERVRRGVGAVRALVGPLARVGAHVSAQLAQLDARVVALRCTGAASPWCGCIARDAPARQRW